MRNETDIRLVVEAVADATEKAGFERLMPMLTVSSADDDVFVASWIRPRDDEFHCDGVSVWTGGYVNIGIGG